MSQELIDFREAQPVDFPVIALLVDRANAQRNLQQLPESLADTDTLASLEDKFKKSGVWADIALLGERIAGISLGYPATEATDLPDEYSDAEYISLLMVEPRYWGKRIGSLLLDRAAERVRHANKQQIVLLTRERDNARTHRFYEHKGYVQTGDTRPSKYGRQLLYLLNI